MFYGFFVKYYCCLEFKIRHLGFTIHEKNAIIFWIWWKLQRAGHFVFDISDFYLSCKYVACVGYLSSFFSMLAYIKSNQICFHKLMLIKWIFHRCNGRNPDLKNIAVFSILCYYNFKELEKVWKLLNKPLNSCISSICPLVWKMSTISDQTFAIFFPTKIYADFIFTDTTRF